MNDIKKAASQNKKKKKGEEEESVAKCSGLDRKMFGSRDMMYTSHALIPMHDQILLFSSL